MYYKSDGVEYTPPAVNSDCLGHFVTWSTRRIGRLLRTTLADKLVDAGLDPSFAKELSRDCAFTRGCKMLSENRVIDRLDGVQTDTVTFQFTKKQLEGGQFAHWHEALIHLDKITGAITCPDKPGLGEMAQRRFDKALIERNTSDVTRLIQRMFAKNADMMPIIKEEGRSYFVPAEHTEFLLKVRTFVRSIGGRFVALPIGGGGDDADYTTEEVSETVADYITGMIGELAVTVDNWDAKTRLSTFTRKNDEYQSIRFKMRAYSTYLKGNLAKVEHCLDAAQKQMASKIGEVQAASRELQAC